MNIEGWLEKNNITLTLWIWVKRILRIFVMVTANRTTRKIPAMSEEECKEFEKAYKGE
jgi:hypothetical protein